jgi:hypothetical protein
MYEDTSTIELAMAVLAKEVVSPSRNGETNGIVT